MNGVIVTLLPDQTYVRARPTTTDHHLTVMSLGNIGHPDLTPKALKGYWRNMVKMWGATQPVQAEVTAEAMFDVQWGRNTRKWAHVDLIDSPFLPSFRSVSEELLQVHGLPLDEAHGFLPHITRRYINQDRDHIQFVQRTGKFKFTFDRMAIWAGDERFELELG